MTSTHQNKEDTEINRLRKLLSQISIRIIEESLFTESIT